MIRVFQLDFLHLGREPEVCCALPLHYGSVYKGVLSNGKEIVVKRLFFNATQRVDQFFNEVALINQVHHKNLVKLLGCNIEGPKCLLVYDYLCNTSLEKVLFDKFKKNELDRRTPQFFRNKNHT